MITCKKCQKVSGNELLPMFWFRVSRNGSVSDFCSRLCLVEHLAPEVGKACIVKRWVPNEDEEDRMRQ